MNELIVKYKVARCHYIYKLTELIIIIISDLQFTTSKRAISISYILIMDIILMKDSMIINDMLYILQHFNLNFISFFIVYTVVFYNYNVFHDRVTLFFADFSTECQITVKFLHNFF